MKLKKLLNTWYGSYVKVFLSAVLTILLAELSQGYSLFSMDWVMGKKLIAAGVVSLLPIVINALNSEDKRYGKKVEPIKNLNPDLTNKN